MLAVFENVSEGQSQGSLFSPSKYVFVGVCRCRCGRGGERGDNTYGDNVKDTLIKLICVTLVCLIFIQNLLLE